VLGALFTADTAEAHTARGERLRTDAAGVEARHPLPVTGYGSMRALGDSPELQELLSSASTCAGSTQRRAATLAEPAQSSPSQ
jgi:hypothetical protein